MAGMTGMQVWMTCLTRMTTITGMTKTQRFPGMTAMIRMTTVTTRSMYVKHHVKNV